MEELVDAVLAGVEEAKSKGLRRYTFILPESSCQCNIALEQQVQEQLPGYAVNHMTITYQNGRVEKRLVIDW